MNSILKLISVYIYFIYIQLIRTYRLRTRANVSRSNLHGMIRCANSSRIQPAHIMPHGLSFKKTMYKDSGGRIISEQNVHARVMQQ